MKTALRLLAFALAMPTAHSQVAPAAKSTQVPTLEVESDEVSLDLVVRDRRNKHPVLDLQPADITVSDDGNPVKITSLRLVNGQTASEHLITMVFDQVGSGAAKYERETAEKILKAFPDRGFSFAITSVDSRLRLVQNYTGDRQRLIQAISSATRADSLTPPESAIAEKRLIAVAQAGEDESGAAVGPGEQNRSRIMLAALTGAQQIVQDQHSDPSLAGIEALTRAQKDVRGRKVVLYFTHGFNPNARLADSMQSIVGIANKAGVSVYVIQADALDERAAQDLAGAMTEDPRIYTIGGAGPAAPGTKGGGGAGGFEVKATASPIRVGGDQMIRLETVSANGGNEPLARMAAATGGAYLAVEENPKKALQRLVEDMTTYYEASYVPNGQPFDGKFHVLDVKPVRPGLLIHSRAGYLSVPLDVDSAVQPYEAPLLKALAAAPSTSDVPFHTAILQVSGRQQRTTGELIVAVPVSSLEMRRDANAGLYSVHLAMIARITDASGKVVSHFSEDLPRHGALDSAQEAQKDVITLQRHFDVPPGSYSLEIGILDRNSDKIGAERSDFHFAARPNGPSLSDLAMVRRTEALGEAPDPLEPLRYRGDLVVPDLSPSAGTGKMEIFFVAHPDPLEQQPPRVEMQVLRDGRVLVGSPVELHAKGSEDVPCLESIQAGSLPPGRYQLKTTITQAGQSDSRSLDFTIPGAATETAARPAPDLKAEDTDRAFATGNILSGSTSQSVIVGAANLEITSPVGQVEPPPQEQHALLENARRRALNYSASLPNFACIETTNRSVDRAGNTEWRHLDSLVELLQYRDRQESRMTLEVDGKPSRVERVELGGAIVKGEFGEILRAVFDPSVDARFTWTSAVEVAGQPTQVFAYQIAQSNSGFTLTGGYNQRITVAFHGFVYIDSATFGVRRITLEADAPGGFSIHSTSIAVDYDFVNIALHDYLMPVRATVVVHQGKKETLRNQMEFRNYRRFGSKVKLVQESSTANDR